MRPLQICIDYTIFKLPCQHFSVLLFVWFADIKRQISIESRANATSFFIVKDQVIDSGFWININIYITATIMIRIHIVIIIIIFTVITKSAKCTDQQNRYYKSDNNISYFLLIHSSFP